MPKPATLNAALALVRSSELVSEDQLRSFLADVRPDRLADLTPEHLLGRMVQAGLLTLFQATQLRDGRHQGFKLGQYRLLDKLGTGGMGQVYLAEHCTLTKRVAIKVLRRQASSAPMARERFLREAQAAARLDHENIVRVFDFFADSTPAYLVMEYVDGKSLQHAVAACGVFSYTEAAWCGCQVALGLQHAHEASLVHRDVKPANILIDRRGVTKLLDLGIVHIEGESITQRIPEHTILGTLDYLAPEQARDSSAVDTRADIYSLGATLYFVLSGCPPITGQTSEEKLLKLQHEEPIPLNEAVRGMPAEFAGVIHKMLAKHPDDRYATPADVVRALAPWAHREPLFPARLFTNSRGNLSGCHSLPLESSVELRTPVPQLTSTGDTLPTDFPHDPLITAGSGMFAALTDDSLNRRSGLIAQARPTPPADTLEVQLAAATAAAPLRRSAMLVPIPSARAKPRRPTSILLVVALLVVFLLGWRILANRKQPSAASETPPTPTETTRAALPLPALIVSRSPNYPNAYPSVRAAMLAATHNQRIELRDPQWTENLLLTAADKTAMNITIVGVPPPGQRIVWSGTDHTPTLISVVNRRGLTLNNLTLDGRNHQSTLLENQTGSLRIENVTFENCTDCAIKTDANIDGRSVLIRNCRFLASRPGADSAMLLNNAPNELSGLRIEHCRIEGPFRHGIRLSAAVLDVTIERNRIYGVDHAIAYSAPEHARYSFGLNVRFNAIACATTGILFFSQPDYDGIPNRLLISGNVFDRVETLMESLNLKRYEPKADAPQIPIWAPAPHGLTRTATQQAIHFRKEFTIQPEHLRRRFVIEATGGDEFQLWLNGEPLAKSPATGSPTIHSFTIWDSALKPRNVLTVSVSIDAEGTRSTHRAKPAPFLCTMGAIGPPVLTDVLYSDTTWKCTTGSVPPEWNQLGSNDSAWATAIALPLATKVLESYVYVSGLAEGMKLETDPGQTNLANGGREGLPYLHPIGFVKQLPTDPTNDQSFLRVPTTLSMFEKRFGIDAQVTDPPR